jgi:hypothetical protein
MKYLRPNPRCVLTIIIISIALLSYVGSVQANVVPPDIARILQEHGYPADTPEQIIEATKSESHFVRYIALELLTQRMAEKAIPTLKESLNDPELIVRWEAAHWLGTLGDKSGLGQMRKDFAELELQATMHLPDDPNMDTDTRERFENQKNMALHDALDVARVLAELDDRRGYQLAARMALEGQPLLHRYGAIYVLTEIAKADPNTLAAEGIDPASVLCAMAESEKDPIVFSTLTSSTEKLPPDIAVRVLERAVKSTHQPQKHLKVARIILVKVKAKIDAADNKSQTTSKKPCCD